MTEEANMLAVIARVSADQPTMQEPHYAHIEFEDRDVVLRYIDTQAARIATLESALRSFLHLTKRSADDAPGEDALSRLPDSHTFELTWGTDGSGYPQITAGQIKRARALLKEYDDAD